MKRTLDFEVKNYTELNKMLLGLLMDVRRGEVDHETAKVITLVADKVNKNNSNALDYKRLSKSKDSIEFFDVKK